jgi:hypothetical protein
MSLDTVLVACTDDTLLAIATSLPTATDLLHLALACRTAAQRLHFTTTSYSSEDSDERICPPEPLLLQRLRAGGGASAAPESDIEADGDADADADAGVDADVDMDAAPGPERWSILEEAARSWLARCSEQERGWVPRRGRESWLGLMRAVEVYRCAAVFGRSHASSIELSEDGARATKVEYSYRAAASLAVMRAGQHYAEFTLVARSVEPAFGPCMLFGVVTPRWDVEGGTAADRQAGNCFFSTEDGVLYPDGHEWEGMQAAAEIGDRVGLLLDLDRGTLTVYKNGERLGVMVSGGLLGTFSWAVSLGYEEGHSARIEPAPLPPLPDEA